MSLPILPKLDLIKYNSQSFTFNTGSYRKQYTPSLSFNDKFAINNENNEKDNNIVATIK